MNSEQIYVNVKLMDVQTPVFFVVKKQFFFYFKPKTFNLT